MRVSCPSCSTAYEVPDRVLGTAGRTLRCARCGAEWTISAPEPEPRPEEATAGSAFSIPPQPKPPHQELTQLEPSVATPYPRTPPILAAPEPPLPFDRVLGAARPVRGDSRAEEVRAASAQSATPAAVWLGWAGTIILLVLLVWCGFAFRTEVMHFWPASQRLYALFGMDKVGP